ncbi:hypothetical protein TNCV_2395821 [Trichonephila clavipes]|nr:hypothetical protein TNCV_2395821 [Trichonephila clavipes]
MLVRIPQELLKTLRHFQTLPWPVRSPICAPEHVWDQQKRQMPSCYSVHDFRVGCSRFVGPSAQDNISKVSNQLNAGPVMMHCSWRSNAPLKLPSIYVEVAHPVIV